MSGRRLRRRPLLIGAGFLVVLVALPFIAVRFVDSESIKQNVLDRVRGSTGYAIEAGPASTALGLGGVHFRIDSLSVVAPDGSLNAQVDRVDATLRLLPLLRKEVGLERVVLERPRVATRATTRESDGLSRSPVFAFLGVRRWEVRDGSFRRETPSGGFELAGLGMSGSYVMDPATGSTIEASGGIDELRQHGAGAVREIGDVSLASRMQLNPAGTRLVVESLVVGVLELEATLAGELEQTAEGWIGELRGGVDPVELDRLIPLAGEEQAALIAPYEPAGTIAVEDLVVGMGTAGARISGLARITEASMILGEGARERVRGEAAMRFDGNGGAITKATVYVGSHPLEVTGRYDVPAGLLVAGLAGTVAAPALEGVLGPRQLAGNGLTGGTLTLDLSVARQGDGPPRPNGSVRLRDLVVVRSERIFPATSGVLQIEGDVITLREVTVALADAPLTEGSGRITREGEMWVLESFEGAMAGGRVDAVGGWTPGTGDQAESTLRLTGNVRGVDVGPWTASRLPTGRITGRMDGTFGLVGIGTGTEGLDAGVNFRVSDGVFEGFPGVTEVIERLQLKGADPKRWKFRDLIGVVEVKEGRVVVDSLGLDQDGLRWRFGGSVGLDRTLALDGLLLVDADRVTLPSGLDVLARHVTDASGRIPIDLAVRGTPQSPEVLFDWDRFAARAAERAKDEQTDKLEELLEDTIKDPGLLDRLKKKLKKP